jgi:hypothetical protein
MARSRQSLKSESTAHHFDSAVRQNSIAKNIGTIKFYVSRENTDYTL